MKVDEECYDTEIFQEFNNAVKKALYQTDLQEREDLQQELYIKLFEKKNSLNFKKEAPSFWSFFKKI